MTPEQVSMQVLFNDLCRTLDEISRHGSTFTASTGDPQGVRLAQASKSELYKLYDLVVSRMWKHDPQALATIERMRQQG